MSSCKELIERAANLMLDEKSQAAKNILDDVIKNKECASYHAEAHMYLGHILEEQEKYEDALTVLNKAIELNKDKKDNFIYGYSYQGRGMVLKHSRDIKDINEAISCYKKAINFYDKIVSDTLMPAYRESTISSLIFAYILGDHLEEAERRLDQAIRNKELPFEDLADSLVNLGHGYYNKRKDYKKASSLYERAAMTKPKEVELKAEIYNYYGRALYMLGDFEKAKKYLELSIPLIKNNREWHNTTQQFIDKIIQKGRNI